MEATEAHLSWGTISSGSLSKFYLIMLLFAYHLQFLLILLRILGIKPRLRHEAFTRWPCPPLRSLHPLLPTTSQDTLSPCSCPKRPSFSCLLRTYSSSVHLQILPVCINLLPVHSDTLQSLSISPSSPSLLTFTLGGWFLGCLLGIFFIIHLFLNLFLFVFLWFIYRKITKKLKLKKKREVFLLSLLSSIPLGWICVQEPGKLFGWSLHMLLGLI